MEETLKIEIRDIRDSDWYWISRKIFEYYAPKIGAIGLALYNAYASYAREKGSAFPSQRTISKKLGISLKTIRKYNRILEENGLIKIESGKRMGKSNVITLLKIGGRNLLPRGCEPSSHPGGERFPTKENNMKENKNKEKEIDGSLINEVFRYFKETVGDSKGFIPEIDWAKDGKLVKARLKNYSLEEIKGLIDWYLKSEISDRLGVSLSACLSAHVINLWKACKSQSTALEKLYPAWRSGE